MEAFELIYLFIDLFFSSCMFDCSYAALGDILVLIGCVFYAISNIGQEYIVKVYDRAEFLGMIGVFGTMISIIQVIGLERDNIQSIDWAGCKCDTLWTQGWWW